MSDSNSSLDDESKEPYYTSEEENYDSDSIYSQTTDSNDDNTTSQIPPNKHEPCKGMATIELDPKLDNISSHSSDDELASDGYELSSDGGAVDQTSPADGQTIQNYEEPHVCSCNDCPILALGPGLDYCCKNSQAIDSLIQEENMQCITKTAKFKKVIEDKDMLLLLRYTYAKGANEYLSKHMDNNLFRHLCYKFFVFLIDCHTCVYQTRYILPACVISRVRELYPEQSGQYHGFEGRTANVLSYKDL